MLLFGDNPRSNDADGDCDCELTAIIMADAHNEIFIIISGYI